MLCPAEAPYKAKYRSEAGLVSCGEARLVGRCLCLDTSPGAKVRRQVGTVVGTVVGTQCRCKVSIMGGVTTGQADTASDCSKTTDTTTARTTTPGWW